MKRTLILLFAAVGLACLTGVAAADPLEPHWPDDETTTNESDAPATDGTAVGAQPGQQLAGAVGAQGASVQGQLLNQSLSARLANATTPARRAEVVAEEAESMAAYLDALAGVRENLTAAWAAEELSEGEYRAALAEFVVRARTVERRANRTARAAEDLPASTRRSHDINATRIRGLGERAHDLYQFEDPVARDVVNETLDDESDERTFPAADGRSA